MAAEYCLGDHPKPASRDHLKTGRSIAAQNDDGLRRGSPQGGASSAKAGSVPGEDSGRRSRILRPRGI